MKIICNLCHNEYNGVLGVIPETEQHDNKRFISFCPVCRDSNVIQLRKRRIEMIFTDAIDPSDPSDNPYKHFTNAPNYNHICDYFSFDTPEEFVKEWKRIVNEPHGMWYWVIDNGECICSGAPDPYDYNIFIEHWRLDKPISPDEFTARMQEIREKHYNIGDDEEVCHILMDDLMTELLSKLGYQDGVAIFEDTPKWYA